MAQLFKTLYSRTISQYFACYFNNILAICIFMRDKDPYSDIL